ncbi:MAG TPA: C2 family cysteine protease [Ktedonobacteraceae bacterium]|jgi:hypothetical protein|nr:C2 family cysteine protease [Ktedonobacteraceae bacterium]
MDDKKGIINQQPTKVSGSHAPPQTGYYIVVGDAEHPEAKEVPVYDRRQGEPATKASIGQAVKVSQIQEAWCQVQRPEFNGWMPVAHVAFQPQPAQTKITWSKSNGPLYGKNGAPDPDDVRQGNLGDCYFLAPLAAIANTLDGKKLIMAMLRPKAPGLFQVTFCNINSKNKVYLNQEEDSVIVDSWFPLASSDNSKPATFLYCPAKPIHDTSIPIWPAVLEKAYAQWDPDGYKGLDNQACSRAIAHLTGLEPRSLHWNPTSTKQAKITWNNRTFAFEEQEDEMKDKMKAELPNVDPADLLLVLREASKNADAILVAGSLIKSKNDTNFLDEAYEIKDSHQYVILQINEDGSLLLWEPKAGQLKKPLPIEKFAQLFDDVLTVNCSQSLFFK